MISRLPRSILTSIVNIQARRALFSSQPNIEQSNVVKFNEKLSVTITGTIERTPWLSDSGALFLNIKSLRDPQKNIYSIFNVIYKNSKVDYGNLEEGLQILINNGTIQYLNNDNKQNAAIYTQKMYTLPFVEVGKFTDTNYVRLTGTIRGSPQSLNGLTILNVHTKYFSNENELKYKPNVILLKDESLQSIGSSLNHNATVIVEGVLKTKYTQDENGKNVSQLAIEATNIISTKLIL